MQTEIYNNEEYKDKESESKSSRRGFFVGLVSGALASAVLGKQTASADVVGADTAAITKMWLWMKAEYAIIAPYIKMIKDNVELTRGFVQDFNKFVTKFNTTMRWLQDVRTLLTEPKENVFYQQYKQIANYIDAILKQKDNDLLSFRLHYFNPVLISKIDSMMADLESMYNRGQEIVEKYKKSGGKFDSKTDEFRQTKQGKAAIRMSNDQAKYIESIVSVTAIRHSLKEIKEQKLPEYMSRNQTTKNSMEIYNEMISPKMLDAILLQTSIQCEIYQKLNDFFMILCKEDPVIADNEEFVSREQIKKFVNQMKADPSHRENKRLA